MGAGQALQGYSTPNCYTIAGQGGIAPNALGALLNVTTTQHPGDGWLTLFPMGAPVPATSNVNFAQFEMAIANSAIVKIGANNKVCVTGMTGAHVIIDAVGYLTP
jgi:hypothetical protein